VDAQIISLVKPQNIGAWCSNRLCYFFRQNEKKLQQWGGPLPSTVPYAQTYPQKLWVERFYQMDTQRGGGHGAD